MKILNMLAGTLALCLTSACASIFSPRLSSKMTREEALTLYNGEIAENSWLERLDTISRNIPGACSVQLADGFLFYKTEKRGDVFWVVEVIPPADAPEKLKSLAKSLNKTAEKPTRALKIDEETLTLDGKTVSEKTLLAELETLAGTPHPPRIKIFVGEKTLAGKLNRLAEAVEKTGLETEIVFESESVR